MAISITDKTSRLFKKMFGIVETKVSTLYFNEGINGPNSVKTNQIWLNSSQIENTAPSLTNMEISGVTQYYEELVLENVPGSNAYYHSALTNAIPSNYGDGSSYLIHVYDNDGNEMAPGNGDWLVDTEGGVLTYYGTPGGTMPPKISFYKYIGLTMTEGISTDTGLTYNSDNYLVTQKAIKGYIDGQTVSAGGSHTEIQVNSGNNFATDSEFTYNWDTDTLNVTNIHVTNSMYVSGTTTFINTENMNISDNLIVINSGETGAGVTVEIAGIEIDRGSLTNYLFVFDEDQDNFRVGVSGSTQAVATREDVPNDSGFTYWNDVLNRFDTNSLYTFNTIYTKNEVNANTLSANTFDSVINTNGVSNTGNISTTGELNVSNTIISSGEVSGTTSFTIETLLNTAGDGMVLDYVVMSGQTNKQTGTLQIVWDDTTVNVAETTTYAIGDTSGIEIDAANDGTNIDVVLTDSNSGTWTVKYFRKLI